MTRSFRAAIIVLVVLCLTSGDAGALPYTVEFANVPQRVAEKTALTAHVRYHCPAGKSVRLQVELKNAAEVVLESAHTLVAGSGEANLELHVPSALQCPEVRLAAWMGDNWQQSLCPIIRSNLIAVLSWKEQQRWQPQEQAARIFLDKLPRLAAGKIRVGVIAASFDGVTTALTGHLVRQFASVGLQVITLDAAAASNPFVLTPRHFGVILLPDCRTMPAGTARPLQDYFASGGRIVALNGPAFQRPLWSVAGKWLDRDQYLLQVARSMKVHPLVDFDTPDIGTWQRATNSLASPSAVSWQTPGANGSRGCAMVDISNLTGWDTFTMPMASSSPFPAGDSWTVFWARGDSLTSQLAIEWRETDTSRWIAVVPLTTKWRPYALPPEAFRYWSDNLSKHRGGPGDRLNPAHAVSLTFGLADTHTRSVGHGPHRFWIDRVGTAAAPPDGEAAAQMFQQTTTGPIIETLAPPYKLYPVTDLARLRWDAGQALFATPKLPAPRSAMSPYCRPQGTGIDKGRRWRFVPVLDCVDARGRVCGTAASLLIGSGAADDGGMVLSVPVTDPAFFAHDSTCTWIVGAVKRMIDGVFLYEGGAKYYASFGSEAMPVGVTVVNRGIKPRRVDVKVEVRDAHGRAVREKNYSLDLPPGARQSVSGTWQVPPATGQSYRVSVELVARGRIIDRLQHDLLTWHPKAQPDFITIRNGDFYRDGRPWYAHGVNYMPSSGIGIEDTTYFEQWLSAQSYDPDVIERDLDDVKAMGFNMVSVFIYHDVLAARNLLDLLIRCERHGLKVNLSLRPGTPMDFLWDQMKDIVLTMRLPENDTVFAYDLAWEPSWGNHERRLAYDGEWAQWVTKHYDSISAAETAWGCPMPMADGKPTNPGDNQLRTNGPWLKMVTDYRQFLDDLLAERYGNARKLMRSIDPHHFVSFRMSLAGDPTADAAWIGYDFAGLRHAVDILEPEGYGRIGDWDRVRDGCFTTAYGRAVAPGLPVMWAEFGYTIWDTSRMKVDAAREQTQARFYDDFYRMCSLSHANGAVCWWFPGGYRWNEHSDFGIINPDRSWRPVSYVIRKWATKLEQASAHPTPTTWIPIDRTAHCDGLAGIYHAVKDQFWTDMQANKIPGLQPVWLQHR